MMTRFFVSGGTGYVASHIVDQLLQQGHSVVTSVRYSEQARRLETKYASFLDGSFRVVIVEDICRDGAFDRAVASNPPVEVVIHPTSPFHFEVTNIQQQLLNPAIQGTTGILNSVYFHAPSVKRVVITSSLAAMIHPWEGAWPGNWPGHVYTEDDWNPITATQAYQDVLCGYRASKKQAEQAAWAFMAEKKPSFALTTICPPLILGPTISVNNHNNLSNVNESLKRIRTMIDGTARAENRIPDNGAAFIFVDVRDAAAYHIAASMNPQAAGQRLFIPTGWFSNREIAQIIARRFPELREKLAEETAPGGGWPEDGMYTVDNSRTRGIIDMSEPRDLETCIVDAVKSLLAVLQPHKPWDHGRSDSGTVLLA